MKVKCIFNQGKYLPSSYHGKYCFPETRFDVIIDCVYTVYGICIYDGILNYLISHGNESSLLPSWYPSALFDVIDTHLPTDWHFTEYLRKSEYGMQAIFGYKELVLDENHNDDLLEREVDAIKIFLAAKRKIDEELEQT